MPSFDLTYTEIDLVKAIRENPSVADEILKDTDRVHWYCDNCEGVVEIDISIINEKKGHPDSWEHPLEERRCSDCSMRVDW